VIRGITEHSARRAGSLAAGFARLGENSLFRQPCSGTAQLRHSFFSE
jgi:hypothetical protein